MLYNTLKKNKKMSKQTNNDECYICLEKFNKKLKEVILEDCGHSGICTKCLEKIEKCPLCRKLIKSNKKNIENSLTEEKILFECIADVSTGQSAHLSFDNESLTFIINGGDISFVSNGDISFVSNGDIGDISFTSNNIEH